MAKDVIFQYFEWNIPNKGKLWRQLARDAAHLKKIGITAVWLPPVCKAMGNNAAGYDIYDLFDLGEFYQKGTIRTKYGTKNELKRAVDELHENGLAVYLDAVMNHKAGADYNERIEVVEVDPANRTKPISGTIVIEGATGFDFPGRGNIYSSFKWNKSHFTGVDYDAISKRHGIFLITEKNKGWSENVDVENGNYDYLMFADIDYNNPDIVGHMIEWGIWITKELGLDGMRLDAIKHIDSLFIRYFIETLRAKNNKFYFVGEYWRRETNVLQDYLKKQDYSLDLFDVPLHYNLSKASQKNINYDLRDLFNDTLVKDNPDHTVTFVENHDTQQGSALESVVADWFKPLAYALLLLMKDGTPCVFYGDYYNIEGKSDYGKVIDFLLDIRRKYAIGEQLDYFDNPTSIGFVRIGEKSKPDKGLVLLISSGNDSVKNMFVGKEREGEIWYDLTGKNKEEVIIDKNGSGYFRVKGCSFSVWVSKKNERIIAPLI